MNRHIFKPNYPILFRLITEQVEKNGVTSYGTIYHNVLFFTIGNLKISIFGGIFNLVKYIYIFFVKYY